MPEIAKNSQNLGFQPKTGYLAISGAIFAGILGSGSLEIVLKSSNFDLKDGPYAIGVVFGGLILVEIFGLKTLNWLSYP